MLFLLSPAKRFDVAAKTPHNVPASTPRYLDRARELRAHALTLGAERLGLMMHLSPALTALAHQRLETLTLQPDTGKQAALAFDGEVYRSLDAASLSPDDLAWAQDRVRIISGLYGLLRPCDLIEPYRFEMGMKLPANSGLHAYWNEHIGQEISSSGASLIVSLASAEYEKAIGNSLKIPRLRCAFHEVKNGRARPLFMYTRKARGMMARYAIQNRIDTPVKLKSFSLGGYRFDPDASDEARYVFTRPQPIPAGRAVPAGKA